MPWTTAILLRADFVLDPFDEGSPTDPVPTTAAGVLEIEFRHTDGRIYRSTRGVSSPGDNLIQSVAIAELDRLNQLEQWEADNASGIGQPIDTTPPAESEAEKIAKEVGALRQAQRIVEDGLIRPNEAVLNGETISQAQTRIRRDYKDKLPRLVREGRLPI